MPIRPDFVSSLVIDRAAELFGTDGHPVRITKTGPAATGWSPSQSPFPWLARLTVQGWSGGTSVVVKTQRPDDHWRQTDTTVREQAALTFLADRSSCAGPRLLGADDDLGIVVLEDLGSGPAVEDLLVGADPEAAADAVVEHARVLAELQNASLLWAPEFYARFDPAGTHRREDRLCVQVMPFRARWQRLREATASIPGLPDLDLAERDRDTILAWLDDPGPMLGLTNGDFMPQNSRVGPDGSVRLLDFEGAGFQHVLLDACQLRIPYAAAPSWGTIPPEVVRRAEQTYRSTMVENCPALADDRVFATGMTCAIAAWMVVRATRLVEVDASGDEPQPFGWTDRGQLSDLMRTAVAAATATGQLPGLRAWLEQTLAVLDRRWGSDTQLSPPYPAFR